MKRPNLLKVVFIIALIIIKNSYAENHQSSPKKSTIAVMSYADFVPDRTGVQNNRLVGLPDVLAGRIIEHLSNSQRFSVVERNALRRVVLEQRFGQSLQKNYLDKTLDKAIDSMEKVYGGEVDSIASWGNYNDVVKDFQDLGGMIEADYIVLGNLEKVQNSTRVTAIPYSSSGKVMTENTVDARLRLRVIEVKTGRIAGAASIKTQLSEMIFFGRESQNDEFSMFDKLAKQATVKILDMTFPAKLVSLDPLIISRGSNDGVKSGDKYTIKREGKAVKDSNGLVLAHLKTDVGVVEVTNVQSTIAIAKPLTEQAFQIGDLAEINLLPSGSRLASSSASAQLNANQASSSQSKSAAKTVLAMGALKLNKSAKLSGGFNYNHVKRIADEMISRFTNSKRFRMMERAEVDQILDEKTFAAITAGEDIKPRLAELGEADYLIHGEVINFYATRKYKKVAYLDEVQVTTTVYAEGMFRIVDVHSGAIVSSENIRIKKKITGEKGEGQIMSDLISEFAVQAVKQIILRIYPIKVMGSSADGLVYLNRGAGAGIKVGQEYQVMRPGQELIDPDTGQSFGTAESRVARVVIVAVDEAKAQAEITSGEEPKRGDILRKAKKVKKTKSPRVMQPDW